MVEKVLHAGNVSACVGAVVTAAETSVFGGATLMIGAALSGLALFRGLKPAEQSVAQDMARALDQYLARAHLTPDRKRIMVQMLSNYPPTHTDLARGNMLAETIADHMRGHITTHATDPAHCGQTALDDYAAMLRALLAPVLTPSDATQAMLTELLARTDKSGQSDRLRDEGITENAIIRLAQRIARETDDLGQAWLDLQNAMDIAVRVQQEGRIPSNHGDFVDEVLARATRLSATGDYTAASSAIAEALAEEEAQHLARTARLLHSGIEIAMLEGNSARAATLLIQKADLEAGGRAGFDDLRALQDSHHVEGRDKGTALPLRIAIDLAHALHTRASTADERGTALNDLGVSLLTVGERESGTERLQEAVIANRAALEEFPRDRVPLAWAGTQTNLGNALRTLGERESGIERLGEAVIAYCNALEEWTRDHVPLQWAMTHMNLGAALQTLGERESGTARLEEAVNVYRRALEDYTRDRVPLQWAATQMNLGTALQALGERESGTERLEEAVIAYRDALEEFPRDRVPLDWAMTQMNLGTALATLGERESGTERLDEAVIAYRDALEEWTRDRVPLQWAITKANLAELERAFFDKTGDAAHLDRAEDHARAALKVFDAAGASHHAAYADTILAKIAARRGG
ncbi:tetratricopeptide repeat protein [Roseovarius sp. MBR-6]|jgi:tetratricopeptide (TPR) repeat protein|uniref:tetratricopeptide repeat protein n=1 Tax=Roseovarius sp. MBR-6 TaxID=3156459 RepID=UPI003399F846